MNNLQNAFEAGRANTLAFIAFVAVAYWVGHCCRRALYDSDQYEHARAFGVGALVAMCGELFDLMTRHLFKL